MHPVTVRLLRLSYGEPQEAFARRLERHPITVARWESGALAPDARSERRLASLAEAMEIKIKTLDCVLSIVLLAEAGDGDTTRHALRVARLVEVVSRRMSTAAENIFSYVVGALLHDIGKVAISKKIFEHPGKLEATERLEIQKHAGLPFALIEAIAGLTAARSAAEHHEKLDGSGYPNGLAGTEISAGGRIVGACDCFDARTSERGYRTNTPTAPEVLREMLADPGYDPKVIKTLRRVVADENRREKNPERWAA